MDGGGLVGVSEAGVNGTDAPGFPKRATHPSNFWGPTFLIGLYKNRCARVLAVYRGEQLFIHPIIGQALSLTSA